MAELRFFSYSRADRDEQCSRARFYNHEWGGTGLVPTQSGWDLEYGNIIHQYLEKLSKNGQIDYQAARKQTLEAAIAQKLSPLIARDWSALAEGHLRGFVKCIWPHWIAEYDVVETEKMRHLDINAIYKFRWRQDILLRNKFNGDLVYPDYKTTSSDDPKWIASWSKAPQLHSSAYAMKQIGIEINQMMIQGLYKGWKDKKTGGPGSIFCRGWVNREYSMIPEYSYEYKRAKGWESFSVADEFDDLSNWVANMPQQILTAQFPCTGPIYPRYDIGETWFRQQLIREADVAEAVRKLHQAQTDDDVQQILDRYFRQNFSKCQPSFGFECEYKHICWVPTVGADPLASKLYMRRLQVFEDGVEDAKA